MGGKLSVFRLGLKQNSRGAAHPQAAGSGRTRDRQRRYRKKRFHVSPQALGEGFHDYNLAAPSPPIHLPAIPRPQPPLPLPPAEARVPDPEPEALSDLELARQPAQRGMRICAWVLWIALACMHYKQLLALWQMADRGWTDLR